MTRNFDCLYLDIRNRKYQSLRASYPNWFFEDSCIPRALSVVSPIEINAITLGPFVFARDRISESTRRHETIHFHQQIELLFLLFYFLYIFYWLLNLCRGFSGSEAYRHIPFELEARENQGDPEYLSDRKLWSWINYRK